MNDAAVLNVEGLKVSFRTENGSVTAVEEVGFSVARGETLVILGESGSGKSVSASVVMDILECPPGTVDSGRVTLDGTDLLGMEPKTRRGINGARIAMIFQDPLSSLNPVYSIGTQIAEVVNVHQGGEARARAIELLGRVGIADPETRFGQYPHQFSGGQRQRIMIAMALAMKPDVLIADEPTTALDVTVQRQILDLLRDLQDETGMAIVLITHDLSVAARMADRVVVMKNGRIVETGDLHAVARAPEHPYTRALLGAIPRLEQARQAAPSGAEAKVLLRVEGLSKDYYLPGAPFRAGRTVAALRDISFSLAAGTTLGVVGESGSGKSTLARVLMGLDQPSGGVVHYDGIDLFHMSPQDRRRFHREVQMVFQDPFGSLNPRMTIEDILCEPLAIQKDILPRRAWRDRAAELLDLVGLQTGHLARRPGQFSGGQRQRIAVARALASEPRLIICDEAVSALDVQIQAQIIELLAGLRQSLGLSYIFITHDLPVVRSLSDRIIVMNQGRIVESGETAGIFAAPGHPYTRELLAASGLPDWMAEAVHHL